MRLFEDKLIDELAAKAAASPRRRAHFNLHSSNDDPLQRFVVVGQADTYFRPHRHRTKAEIAVVLRGRMDVVTFDDAGHVLLRQDIGEGTGRFAYEMANSTWHTLIAKSPEVAFLEVKQGPYDPATAADFAAWAPAEGEGSVPRFQQWLHEAGPGSLYST